jgi:hypothetical protein
MWNILCALEGPDATARLNVPKTQYRIFAAGHSQSPVGTYGYCLNIAGSALKGPDATTGLKIPNSNRLSRSSRKETSFIKGEDRRGHDIRLPLQHTQ